jgi:hypothetical protein
MPWGRTWSEELVAEWLELEGFLVTIGLKSWNRKRRRTKRG